MRYLMILEVSQKQAYIFSSTKLRDNIEHSENICQVTDTKYFLAIADREGIMFSEEENLVYSGGGHTVLEFEGEEAAKNFAYAVSRTVKQEFPEIELFLKVMPYEESRTPGENLKLLSEALERKKSVRAASFHQGSFGVERINADSRKPEMRTRTESQILWKGEEEYVPEGWRPVRKFGDRQKRGRKIC